MASIGATLELYDRMSMPLEHIIASVDSLTRAFTAADTASDGIGTAALENARAEAEGACAALENLRYATEALTGVTLRPSYETQDLPLPTPEPVKVPLVWEETNLPVFSGSDAERYALEVADVNERLIVLSETQSKIAASADGTQVFSPAVTARIDGVTSRIDAIRQKISLISENELNIASPGANAQLEAMRAKLLEIAKSQETLNSAVDSMDFSAANAAYNSMQLKLDAIERQIRDNTDAQGAFNDALKEGGNSADGLLGKLKGLAGAYIGIQGVQKLIGFADDITQINARLDMVNELNGSLETTDVLNDKIFASAARARASYETTADAVAKMGIMAHDAFSSNDELIAFTELINKQFAIAGTSAQGIDAAMLQLTQAMSSGVLRGEELNSIFEQAPTIIGTIADYLGKPVGEIRDLAAEGRITADVVKNAMFASADEINGKFESMPYTFAQVWTMITNMLTETFMPIVQVIGAAADFIGDHWSILEPIFFGLAVAVGAYALALGIYTAAQWIATGAAKAFFTALLSNPFMWIALAIGAVVGEVYKWIQSVGGLTNAWNIAKAALMAAWSIIKVGFQVAVNFVMNLVDKLCYCWQAAGVAISGFIGDMKVKVLTILQNMINGAISLINGFISMLNNIPGVSIELIGEMTFATEAALQNEAEKQAREASLADYKAELDAAKASREEALAGAAAEAYGNVQNTQMLYEDAVRQTATKAADEAVNYGDMAADIGEINDTTGGMAKDLECSEENLKYLRDIAERDVINKFTTSAVTVNLGGVTNNVSSGFDLDGIVTGLGERLAEEVYVASEGVHA